MEEGIKIADETYAKVEQRLTKRYHKWLKYSRQGSSAALKEKLIVQVEQLKQSGKTLAFV